MPTQAEINRIISIILGIRDIQDNDRLIESYGAESADIANIVAAVERKFGVHIPEEGLESIQTPADMFRIIQNNA